MAEIPTELPEWASNPPINTITSPTLLQREEGYQPGTPRRQHTNWLFELIYRWLAWLSQAVFRPSLIAVDQAFNGAAPVTGAGLVVAANSFSAGGFVDGYTMPTTQGQAYTYSATSDTYWDLGRDAVWHPVVVAAAAAEPAVTSSPPSVRVFRVRTDAVDRTGIVDRRYTRVRLTGDSVAFSGTVEHGVGRAATSAATRVASLDSNALTYKPLHEIYSDDGSAPNVNVYIEEASRRISTVSGMRYLGVATEWRADQTTAWRTEYGNGFVRSWRLTGLTIGNDYDFSVWTAAPPSPVVTDMRTVLDDLQVLGDAQVVDDLTVGGDAALQGVSAVTAAVSGTLAVTGTSTLGAVAAGAVGATSMTASGAAQGATVVGTTSVTSPLVVGSTSVTTPRVAMDAAVPVTPAANSIYGLSGAKVLAFIPSISAVGVPTYSSNDTLNIASIALQGTTAIRFTFITPMLAGYTVVPFLQMNTGGTPTGSVYPLITARATTYVDISISTGAGAINLTTSGNTYELELAIFGRQS